MFVVSLPVHLLIMIYHKYCWQYPYWQDPQRDESHYIKRQSQFRPSKFHRFTLYYYTILWSRSYRILGLSHTGVQKEPSATMAMKHGTTSINAADSIFPAYKRKRKIVETPPSSIKEHRVPSYIFNRNDCINAYKLNILNTSFAHFILKGKYKAVFTINLIPSANPQC